MIYSANKHIQRTPLRCVADVWRYKGTMNMRMKALSCMVLILFFIFGCSAHRASIEEGVSKSAIYQMDETKIFHLVYSSIQEGFPQEKISVITFPTRGYITKFLAPPLYLDWFTQKVLVHRASGLNLNGREVYGYWIDVSGSGSSFLQGQLKNKEVFDTIITHLEKTAIKHVVSNISKAPYLVSQEEFYVRGADTLEGKGTRHVITNDTGTKEPKSQAQELRDLYKLKIDGLLTEQEYESAKKKILDNY